MFPASVPVHAAAALTVTVTASVTSQIRIQGLYRATKAPELTPFSRNVAHSAGDRTSETTTIASNVQGDIVALSVDAVTAGIKRGTVYVVVQLASYAVTLTVARGYVYEGVPLMLGQFVEPGPGGGEGFKEMVTVGADLAGNTNAALDLAATNAFRRYYGFVLYYNVSGDVADRTPEFFIGRPEADVLWGAVPTGFTSDVAGAMAQMSGPTLSASEEGGLMMYGKDSARSYIVRNDNGTLSYVDAHNIFPLDVLEADTGAMLVVVTNGNANDRYSMYAYREEWLAPP